MRWIEEIHTYTAHLHTHALETVQAAKKNCSRSKSFWNQIISFLSSEMCQVVSVQHILNCFITKEHWSNLPCDQSHKMMTYLWYELHNTHSDVIQLCCWYPEARKITWWVQLAKCGLMWYSAIYLLRLMLFRKPFFFQTIQHQTRCVTVGGGGVTNGYL